jgi:hypothetical protein
MRTGQALFPLGIELGIPRERPWKELLATEPKQLGLVWLFIVAGCSFGNFNVVFVFLFNYETLHFMSNDINEDMCIGLSIQL